MKKVYKVSGIDCANCAAEIENLIRQIDGIRAASLSFLTGRLVVEHNDLTNVDELVLGACRRVEPDCSVQ